MAYELVGGTTNPPHLKQPSAALGLANGCSIACWFMSDSSTGGPRYIAGWGNGSRVLGLAQSGNKLALGDKGSGSPLHGAATTGNSFTAGAWNHAVGIVVADNERRVVLNGDLANMGTVNPSALFIAATDVWVGANIYELNGFANGFNGKVAGLAIYSEILPDEAIVALSRGIAPELVRPHKLEFLTELFGRHSPEIERIRGVGLSLLNSPTYAAGPPLFRPRRRFVPSPAAGDSGAAAVLDGLAALSGVGGITAAIDSRAEAAGQGVGIQVGQVSVRLDGGAAPAGVSAAAWAGQPSAEVDGAPGAEPIGCAAAGFVGMPAISSSGSTLLTSPGMMGMVGDCRIAVSGWSPEATAQGLWTEALRGQGAWHSASVASQAWLPAGMP